MGAIKAFMRVQILNFSNLIVFFIFIKKSYLYQYFLILYNEEIIPKKIDQDGLSFFDKS